MLIYDNTVLESKPLYFGEQIVLHPGTCILPFTGTGPSRLRRARGHQPTSAIGQGQLGRFPCMLEQRGPTRDNRANSF